MKIAFTTLGCKSNQYDTECMIDACRRMGLDIVPFDDPAEAYVINTCTVTALADSQSRQLIRRARKNAPDARIIALGCSAQNDPETYRNMGEAGVVLGVRCTEDLCRYLSAKLLGDELSADSIREQVPTIQSRARALLKVQDGCDKRCTYCAVWMARGRGVSVPPGDVVVRYSALDRYSEVMLTGIHVGQYGRDLHPRSSLNDLIRRLTENAGGPRIRIGSLNPDEIDDEMISLISNPKVCRHMHVSLQSGSPKILNLMGRTYRPEDAKAIVENAASKIPGIAIGLDVIAGFPEETESEHVETVEFIESLPIAFLHVFPYSPRKGTAAAEMKGQVPFAERKRRAQELIVLGNVKRERYFQNQLGSEAYGVVTSRSPDGDGCVRAVTDNYLKVRVEGGAVSYGGSARMKITRVENGEVYGSWI